MFNILNYIRSLSFGGLLGSGIAAYLYLRYPHWFKDKVTFEYFTVFGGLLGASIHNTFGAAIRLLLFPVTRFVEYYGRLVQIGYLRKRGVLDKEVSRNIIEELSKTYFLKGEKDNEQLPHQ